MSTLTQANRQWSTRPADERFTSLVAMQDHFDHIRDHSRASVLSTRRIEAIPTPDNKGLTLAVEEEVDYGISNWAFGQLAQLAEAPAGYLRTLPSPIAADCVNYGLKYKRDIEDVGVLLYRNGGDPICRAATGPRYGRIWNSDIVTGLVDRFGDGLTGDFKVPGEFGKQIEVNKSNTTLYASDRDMFVFLADEDHRIEIPNRRNGEAGSLARGFFVWNSEVGASTFGVATFLFDYACSNRIVWGAEQFREITIRHTASAPDKYIEEITPALERYAHSSTSNIVEAIEAARASRIDNIDDFLAKRFSKRQAAAIKQAHEIDEGRPIENLWDASTGITAYARSISFQDQRVELERAAGKILDLATA